MTDNRGSFYKLNINGRKNGKLLQEKIVIGVTTCLYIDIVHNKPFLQVAVNKGCDKVMAGDQLGFLYLFNIGSNEFRVSIKLNSCLTALKFVETTLMTGVDLVAATAMYNTIHFLSMFTTKCNKKSQYLLKELNAKGEASTLATFESVHRSCVNGIAMLNEKMLTYSSFDCISLWNLNSLQVTRQVKNQRIIKADFLANSKVIVSQVTHKINCVYIFDAHSLDLKKVISGKSLINASKGDNLLFLKDDVLKEVEVLFVNSKMESRIINSLSDNVKQLHFLSGDRVLALKDFGEIECIPPASIVSNEARFMNITIADNLMVAITSTGKLQIYDLRAERTVNKEDEDLKEILLEQSNEIIIQKLTKEVLEKYHQFPLRYRLFVWSKILKLPLNEGSYNAIYKLKESNKECITTIDAIMSARFSDLDLHVTHKVKKLLLCLLQWNPILRKKLKHLPNFVVTLAKAFPDRKLMLFEILATLLLNNFFDPKLNDINDLLKKYCQKLLNFLSKKEINANTLTTSLIESGFCKVCTIQDWLILWDNIIAHGNIFVEYVAVAFYCLSEDVIINASTEDTIKTFFESQNYVPIKEVISKAYELFKSQVLLPTFSIRALTKNVYPVYNRRSGALSQ